MGGAIAVLKQMEELPMHTPALLHICPSPQDDPSPHIQIPTEHVSFPAHVTLSQGPISK